MFAILNRHRMLETFALILLCEVLAAVSPAAEISLRHSAVVVDAGEASYVHYSINELRQQIKAITGSAPVLYYDLKEATRGTESLVVVGRSTARLLVQESGGAPHITDSEPGKEGFVLRCIRLAGRDVVLAAGSDSAGTNYAVMELRQLLSESRSGLGVSATLDMREKPQYPFRVLYLHQHWRYNYPYAAWSWSAEDWKRALDVALCLRANVVLMWPHMDMLAPPLSVSEQDYLANIREVIDYAHRERGIEVWSIEPANVLLNTEQVKRLPMERRDYYAYANMGMGGLQDPGDPQGYARLMANREALYQAVPNADGYGYIDSDPGGWADSPTSAFLNLFKGNRKLLDQYHEHPHEARLVYWVWDSWGKGKVEENWLKAIRGFEETLEGPKELLLGYAPQVEIAQRLGYLGDSILNPYGVIESEPTFPLTSINFAVIARAFDYAAQYPAFQGVMAGAQTFVVQLPNLHYFFALAWGDKTGTADENNSLRSLGKLLLPEKADLLAKAWAQLELPGSGPALAVVGQLEPMAKSCRKSGLGTLGEYIFPDSSQIPADLVMMLRIHASAERVRERVKAGAPEGEVLEDVKAYFRAMLDWQKKNGFFGAFGTGKKVIFNNFIYDSNSRVVQAAWKEFTQNHPHGEELEAGITHDLSKFGYAKWIVDSMTRELFGTEKPGKGDTNQIFRALPANEVLRPWVKP
jgi:hypothetical protein